MKMELFWRFDTPGQMPLEPVRGFETLIDKVVAQGNRWSLLEHFKSHFGGSGSSSSESWAKSDLNRLVGEAAENAPLFIEAFYEACEALLDDAKAYETLEAARVREYGSYLLVFFNPRDEGVIAWSIIRSCARSGSLRRRLRGSRRISCGGGSSTPNGTASRPL